MRYLAGYLLAVLGGNESPSADDVTKILAAGEIDVDAAEVSRLLAAVEGKVRRQPPPPPPKTTGRPPLLVSPLSPRSHTHARSRPYRTLPLLLRPARPA
jgi:hypothetical protein